MANVILTPQVLTNELLRRFKNNLGFAKVAHHEDYREHFGKKGAKIGDTLNIRVPVKLSAVDGAALVVQDVVENKVPLVIDQRFHTAFSFDSQQQTLSVDYVGKRYIESAAVALANEGEVRYLRVAYQNTPNVVGTPGTTPNGTTAFHTYLQAGEALDRNSAPMDGERYMVIIPKAQTEIIDSLKGLFQSTEQIKRQYIKGRMGTAAGFDWLMAQNIRTHTLGSFVGAPLVNGNNQAGGTLLLKGFTVSSTGVLKAGDVITITTSNPVYAVNAVSGDVLSDLRQFTVLADCNSDGGGLVSAPIYPQLIATGPYKTIDATPVDGATVALFGTGLTKSPQMMAFHAEAYAWACPPLDRPRAVEMSATQTDPDTGLSARIVEQYDGVNDLFFWRCDCLVGYVAPRPEWGCRVAA